MPTPAPEPPLDDAALHAMLAGTAGETDEAFFAELVGHLARAPSTKCAWVSGWPGEERRLRALAFWNADRFHDNHQYAVANTPGATVMDNRRVVHVPGPLIEPYSDDPDVLPLGAGTTFNRRAYRTVIALNRAPPYLQHWASKNLWWISRRSCSWREPALRTSSSCNQGGAS